MAEYSVMDRINMIISDPDHATMTLAQIVTEEIREFKASEQYANMIQAEAYYRNRTDVQRKTNDVANRSNTRIEHPILKKLVDQKANYLLGKPFTVDTKNSSYGDALNDVFDQTFRRKIKSLGKGAVKSGIAWLQPYFDDGKLTFMRIPSAELVPIWRDAERTKLDAFICPELRHPDPDRRDGRPDQRTRGPGRRRQRDRTEAGRRSFPSEGPRQSLR